MTDYLLFLLAFVLGTSLILVTIKIILLVSKSKPNLSKRDFSRRDEAMAYSSFIRHRVLSVVFFLSTFVSLIFLYLDPPEDAAEYKKRVFLIFLAFLLALIFSPSLKKFEDYWKK